MKIKKTRIFLFVFLVVAIVLGVFAYNKYVSKTKIALVNFKEFLSSPIALSNQNDMVEYEMLTVKEFVESGKKYDMTLFFGMGLKMSAEEFDYVEKYEAKGTPLLVLSSTSPEYEFDNLRGDASDRILEYFSYGNRKNYQSMANYIRKYIDRKLYQAPEPDELMPTQNDVFYHTDENVAFEKIEDFEAYLKKIGYYHEGGKKVAILSMLIDPFSGGNDHVNDLIRSLNSKGLNVYPVYSVAQRRQFLDQIKPDAIVYLAHGRLSMGSSAEEMRIALEGYNAPIFMPLSILSSKEEWLESKIGMSGGYLSQSVVMPEIDGAIYPYVVNIQEKSESGLVLSKADPVRLENFSNIVSNFMKLREIDNKDKKLAIVYFKGPGQEGLNAQGIEVVPSLYNVLKRLKSEGYTIDLPATEKEFLNIIMNYGQSEVDMADVKEGTPANFRPVEVEKSQLREWMSKDLSEYQIDQLSKAFGEELGDYMTMSKDNKRYVYFNAIRLGNVVLMPQGAAAIGVDSFTAVHGVDSPPPYPYVASYLWLKERFNADAILHFGTHGSLEFTPRKQVALSEHDWSNNLIGTTPSFYYYAIANPSEGIIAKRRSYSTLIDYLDPAFEESNVRGSLKNLLSAIEDYRSSENDAQKATADKKIKKEVLAIGINRDLKLDSTNTNLYTEEEINKIDGFAEEIANERMYTKLYTAGNVYTDEEIKSTIVEMSSSKIANQMALTDKTWGRLSADNYRNDTYILRHYLPKAKAIVKQILSGASVDTTSVVRLLALNISDIEEAKKKIEESEMANHSMPMMMPNHKKLSSDKKDDKKTKMDSKSGASRKKKSKRVKLSDEERKAKEMAMAKAMSENQVDEKYTSILDLIGIVQNVATLKEKLISSPEMEMKSFVNAFNGGFVRPSVGGDLIGNEAVLPTGRNMFSINQETTPSRTAWDRAKVLVDATLKDYKTKHGEYPKKISYTLWAGPFIASNGTTIAQALYMLGVEPVWDMMGRVNDVRLIPSEELGRPRIDIVVQTSGQFRDIATSRLTLITKAVNLAASAKDEKYQNMVADGSTNTEKILVEKGISPAEARKLSNMRVFGGVNGNYGTGTMEMVMQGDKWEDRSEIGRTYINNMGAAYGDEEAWGEFTQDLFEAALQNTDVIVQPRQSNTWGALSLDHVFEFMGGINLAVKEATGKEPEAIFADYRNNGRYKMQDLKEAIGVESRITILNPNFVSKVIKGGQSSAVRIMEIVENTYGWSVSRTDAIDKELWDGFYDLWINDSQNLGTREFFERENQASLQQITGVMLETARKGFWKASPEQIAKLSQLNAELIEKYGASAGSFAHSNAKLQDFIKQNLDQTTAQKYEQNMQSDAKTEVKDGIVLKETENKNLAEVEEQNNTMSIKYIAIAVVALLVIVFAVLRIRNKSKQENE